MIVLVFGVIALFICMSITPSVAVDAVKKPSIPTSKGNTLYVGGTGEGNYTTIQDAIDDASNGDTVYVYNGTYYGNIVVDKSINLVGECRDTTFIEGYYTDVINITADWVNVSGFSIPWGDYIAIGIYSSNNTITGNNIFWVGIGIVINSNYNIISDNNISQCYHGISITNPVIGNSILGNNISSNEEYGIWLDSTNRNTIMGNKIKTNGLSGILLEDSYNNTISGNNISWNANSGMMIVSSQYNTIISNDFDNNTHDLLLRRSNNNTIISNTFSDTQCCKTIGIRNSSNNNINNNIIINGGFSGIDIVDNSFYNIITGNHITTGWEGIRIWYSSSNNKIINNIISNNKYGIYIEEFSSNNTIYHNNLINNSKKAYDECNNTWDNGYPSGGNFWDDYTGNDSDGDGIGDIPYHIPGGDNVDRYPLGNFPPDKPDIDGPPSGKAGVEYCWVFHSEDPECLSIYYYIDWSDGNIVDWFGPYPSCMPVEVCHTYEETGIYVIGAKVKDIYDAESNWTYFDVDIEIPRNKALANSRLLWLLERFPLLEILLSLFRII